MSFTQNDNRKYENSNVDINCVSDLQSYIDDVESCPGLRSVTEKLEPFIDLDKCRLLTGETGAGKEWLARYIHARSDRSQNAFVAVNFGTLSDDRVIAELCGWEKGSFTGANYKFLGRFRLTGDGTIFLDEFNSVRPDVQHKILRIIEEREVVPIGGQKSERFNCRIVVGSNADLFEMVKSGELRQDLYYRINTVNFRIPPLRERPQDIPVISKSIIAKIAKRDGKAIPNISSEAMSMLITNDWPGNSRELSNVLERAMCLRECGVITEESVRQAFEFDDIEVLSFEDALAKTEKGIIEATIWTTPNNAEAAKRLGVSPSTLRDKIRKHGIKSPSVSIRNKGGLPPVKK